MLVIHSTARQMSPPQQMDMGKATAKAYLLKELQQHQTGANGYADHPGDWCPPRYA